MKPDWAERLQRTFTRKYDAGFAKGLMFGKAVGARDEQERIIKSLQEDAESQTEYCKPLDSEHCHTCFEAVRLIKLIKGENK